MLLIAVSSLLLFQSEMTEARRDEFHQRTSQEMNAMMAAGAEWQSCLNRETERYERSGEAANAVAMAAVYQCRFLEHALLEAQVAYRRASVPSRDEQDARIHVAGGLEKSKAAHIMRLTHMVVEKRAGATD